MRRTVFLVVTLLLSSSLAMDCPMVGLDCLFHDIQRAADAGWVDLHLVFSLIKGTPIRKVIRYTLAISRN